MHRCEDDGPGVGCCGVLLFIGLLLILGGCAAQQPAVPAAPVKLPIIALGDVYPRGETAEKFWGDKALYFQDYERRLKAGAVEAREQRAMTELYEIELVRRAAEARVRAYNQYARETNRSNGY